MEKVESDSEKPPGGPGKSGFPVFKWISKIFSGSKNNNLTPEEREKAIEESIEQFATQVSSEDNVLEEDEREMIQGVVELGGTTVKEIMVPRVDIIGIALGSPIKDIIDVITKSGHSRLPLFDDSLDNIKGLIYAKDLLTYALSNENVDLMKIVRKCYFIPENLKIDVLLAQMRKNKLHIAIVVDEYGGTSGLVTMEDIIEEIVGEIEDEYDLEPPPISKISEGIFIVDGTVTISDLNEELELDLPEDESETVGGLIYDLVGSLPDKGHAVRYNGVKLTVDTIDGQRIVKIRLEIEKNKQSDLK